MPAQLKSQRKRKSRDPISAENLMTEVIRLKSQSAFLPRTLRSVTNLVASCPDIIYYVDPEGRFGYVNEAVRNLGFEPAELIGKHFSGILAQSAANITRDGVLPRFTGRITGQDNAPRLFDERRTGPRATRNLEVRLYNRLQAKEGQETPCFGEIHSAGYYARKEEGADRVFLGTVGTIRDITLRKKTDLAISECLAMVSHELRSPLAVVREAVLALSELQEVSSGRDAVRFLDIVNRNVQRMCRTVNDILDLSRLESSKAAPKCTWFHLPALIEEVVQNVRHLVRNKTIDLDFQLPEIESEIFADSDMIARALSNLLDNASRFARSHVTVRAAADAGGDEGDSRVKLSVMDDGPGIAPEDIGRLFNKYEQIKRSRHSSGYKGTGLGLVITKIIVELHDGAIWAESVPGQGAAFHIRIPTKR